VPPQRHWAHQLSLKLAQVQQTPQQISFRVLEQLS